MITSKIGRTLKIRAYCANGHASIFLTLMKVEHLRATFAVATVLGISAHGIINESLPAKDLQEAKKWAVAFAKKKLGAVIKFETTGLGKNELKGNQATKNER